MAIKLKKTEFVRSLIKNHKLAGHIDKAIGSGEFTWNAEFSPKEGDDAWHPSGDCIPTPYGLYQKATATASKPHPISLLKTFTVGHFWHAYIQWIVVERLGFSTWDEIEVRGVKGWGEKTRSNPFSHIEGQLLWAPFSWATGSADIAPCHIPVHGDFLVDIKTMGAHDYKQNGLPAWCAPKYEAQINVYMDWFDLEEAIILCVCKDSPHEFKEFSFQRNQPLIDAIYNKWKLVSDCITAGVEPDEDYDIPLPLVGPKV